MTSTRRGPRAPLGRSFVALAVFALVATACSGKSAAPVGNLEIGDGSPSTSAAAGGSNGGDGGAKTPTGAPSRTTLKRAGTPHPATTLGSRSQGDPIPGAAARGPGGFAGVLLQAAPATRLVLDVLYQPGVEARSGTVDRIASVLRDASDKPVRVSEQTVDVSGETHSAEEIRDGADKFSSFAQGDGTAVIHVLFLSGRFAQSESVLGVAVRGDTFAVFPDQIARASSPPLAPRATVERAVVTHELGHVLGLVDTYLNTNRDDPAHPGHSRNRGSVMFWAVESDLVTAVLDGPPPVEFDQADRNDLAAIRAGAPPA